MKLNVSADHLFFEIKQDVLIVKNERLIEVFRTSENLHLWHVRKYKGIIHVSDFEKFLNRINLRENGK